jgi:ATP-dependent Clp protease ATP-binding subunit ClpC
MENIFFDDPRLRMTVAGRFLVRIVTWVTYLVFSAATFTFLISGSIRLRFAGIFLGLMLVDILVHRGEGDVPIAELPKPIAGVNVAKSIRPAAFVVLERTFDASVIAKRNFFLEVTARLLEFPDVEQALSRLDIPLKDFKQKLDELTAGAMAVSAPREEYLKQAELLAVGGFDQAIANGHNFVEIGDLFAALPGVGDASVTRLFNLFTITASDIERAMIFSAGSRLLTGLPAAVSGFMFDSHRQIRHRVMNRAWTSRPTPTLDRYGTDFTDLARDGSIGFLVGHAAEYERLVETLARPTSPNALLVGDAGIGKEAIVAHLARRLSKDDVPKALFDKRLVSLEVQSVVAGAPPEELTARLKMIVQEIYLAGNIILYIPDIHNLVHTSGTAFLSAADALLPVIKNDGFPVIGATYAKEFKQLIKPRSDFTGAFEVIHVEEITEADAEKILTYEALVLEKQAHVTISFGAIKRAVTIAKKYFHGKFLPSSAVELLKSTVAHVEQSGDKTIGPDLIVKVAETKTNIPIHEASGAEAETLLNMEDIIHKRMIGQEEAVKAVATALREYRSGLSRKGGPIASFLFVGPTGVGKTELAKILADVQFGSEKMMTRFDMTEYQDKASFVRFIGSPDGQTRGALTDAVLEKPYGLILLDEFEKAYPDILNLFLQVLDDGRLTDGLGRTVDFTNTIVIATSNAHSDIINDALAKGESMSQIADYLKSRLVDVFKPELINRFSKIIIFKNLEPKELGQIVALGLAEFAESVKAQGIYLEFDPDAVAQLTKLGYDPAFGARPLRRVIEEQIRAPLAEAILGKKIGKDSRVKLVYKEGKFEFEALAG